MFEWNWQNKVKKTQLKHFYFKSYDENHSHSMHFGMFLSLKSSWLCNSCASIFLLLIHIFFLLFFSIIFRWNKQPARIWLKIFWILEREKRRKKCVCIARCVQLFDIPEFTCYRIDWSWELASQNDLKITSNGFGVCCASDLVWVCVHWVFCVPNVGIFAQFPCKSAFWNTRFARPKSTKIQWKPTKEFINNFAVVVVVVWTEIC